MNREEAKRLLALSRQAEWAFPTSFSNSIPIRSGGDGWIERLSSQRDALARAVRFLIEDEEEAAVELAANVWRLWLRVGDIDGGRALLATVLDTRAARPSPARARALYGDALLAIKQGELEGDLEGSRRRSQSALDVATEISDTEGQVLGLLRLSRVAFDAGELERARSLASEARRLARGLDPAMSQAPLHVLAQATRMSGDYEAASALFEESLELNRRLEDEGMVAVELHNLGHVEVHRGNVDAAERYFSEAAERGSANDPYDVAYDQFNRAVVAFARGDREQAAALFDRARSALQALGANLASDDRFEFEWLARRLAEDPAGE